MANFLSRLFSRKPKEPRLPRDTSPNGVYTGLRSAALASKPSTFGLADTSSATQVYALLMDMGYPTATATIFVGADGTASLYTSTGGDVIGDQAHKSVRNAVELLLAVAAESMPWLSQTTDFPVPADGHTSFVALTSTGAFAGSVPTNQLGAVEHDLSKLFFTAHGVITQLREVSSQ
jgi:hypothetical protein